MSKNPLKSIPEVPGRCPRAQRVQTQDHHRLGAGVGKGLPSPARGPRRGQRRGRGGQGYAGPPAAATRSPPARSSGTYMVSAIIAGGRDPYRRGGRNGRLRGPPTQKVLNAGSVLGSVSRYCAARGRRPQFATHEPRWTELRSQASPSATEPRLHQTATRQVGPDEVLHAADARITGKLGLTERVP